MKPIEQGCWARIVNSKAGNNGIVVRVGKFVGSIETLKFSHLWKINKNIQYLWGGKFNVIDEQYLQRIDEDWKTVEWSACEFIPKDLKETT